MIILNETVIIEPDIHADWLHFTKNIHIPAMMATGFFEAHRILQVLNSPNEGFTYCLQYEAQNIDAFDTFKQTIADEVKNIYLKKFENKLVLFESIMQVIH